MSAMLRGALRMPVRSAVRTRIGAVRCYASAPEEPVLPEYTDFPYTKGDDRLVGDYPEYPYVYAQHRDPYAKYDFQQLRRNYNDPLHEDDDMLNMWSPDVHDYVSTAGAVRWALGFFTVFGLFSYAVSFSVPEKIATGRVYDNGLFKELGGAEDFPQIKPAGVDDGSYYPK
ncbi:hypothetical protein BZA70DRAFT_285192 [Myxozyma melibiosi]|uniref:Uncharacterized protein n=1 Tax=Myxozyma melibiosi TaxID=54550 RepID=A0ABR1EZ25_9ASCO